MTEDALRAAKDAALAALPVHTTSVPTEESKTPDIHINADGEGTKTASSHYSQVAQDSSHQPHSLRRLSRVRPRRKRRRASANNPSKLSTLIDSTFKSTDHKKSVSPLHKSSSPDVDTVHIDPNVVSEENPVTKDLSHSPPPTTYYVPEPIAYPRLSDISDSLLLQTDAANNDTNQKSPDSPSNHANTVINVDKLLNDPANPLAQLRIALERFSARSAGDHTDYMEDDQLPTSPTGEQSGPGPVNNQESRSRQTNLSDDSETEDPQPLENGHDHTEPLSRKKRKEARRELVSILKAVCPDPSVVDAWDVNASDPILLCSLKAVRNSVPVPINWRQKRKYLQNKRGLSKRPLSLPPSIEALGIGVARDAQLATDSRKSLKQRQRERMRAKTGAAIGAADLDDRRLRQAFQQLSKPSLTPLGDVYFELKELEVDPHPFVPGILSDALKDALGMNKGDPPPWLVAMQRWGPPPGWPGLRVPGVNAPIPPGARFGYQPGGWGKPPVDVTGRPVYGDVFGQGLKYEIFDERFDVSDDFMCRRWGVVQPVEQPSVEDEMDETEDAGSSDDRLDSRTEGIEVANRTENSRVKDDSGDLERNTTRRDSMDGKRKSAYQVLHERREWAGEDGLMASSHLYNMEGVGNDNEGPSRRDHRHNNGREERGRDRTSDGDIGRNWSKRGKNQEFKF